MPQIIESIEAHYSTLEVPFGRVYSWHQAHVVLECDCGEKHTFTGTSAITTCRCGADYGALVHDIRLRERQLPDQDEHPWVRNVILEESYKPHTFDQLKEILSEPVLSTI